VSILTYLHFSWVGKPILDNWQECTLAGDLAISLFVVKQGTSSPLPENKETARFSQTTSAEVEAQRAW